MAWLLGFIAGGLTVAGLAYVTTGGGSTPPSSASSAAPALPNLSTPPTPPALACAGATLAPGTMTLETISISGAGGYNKTMVYCAPNGGKIVSVQGTATGTISSSGNSVVFSGAPGTWSAVINWIDNTGAAQATNVTIQVQP